MDDPGTRRSLLVGIPNSPSFDHNNIPQTDLSLMVNQLSPLATETGEKLLRIFIENAKARVRKTSLYNELENFYLQYEQCISKDQLVSPAYHLCEPHHFDLEPLEETFLKKVRESEEIVGFAIPCDYSNFFEIFHTRLKDTIREHKTFKGMINIRRPYVLKYDSIQGIITDIKKLQSENLPKYIYIPVKLGNIGIDKDLPRIFWQAIRQDAPIHANYVIIVALMGRSNCVFPEDMVPLIPSFKEDDAQEWVLDVGTRLGWSHQHVKAQWKDHMLRTCLSQGILDIETTYLYINEVKSIIQDKAEISFDDFISQIKNRSLLYL